MDINSSLRESFASNLSSQRRLLLILGLQVATFITYLTVGLYYITSPMSPYRSLTLGVNGDTFLATYPGWNNRQEFDDAAYNRPAVEILRTGVPRDHTGSLFLYAPVYAYFIAGCYWVGGLRLLAFAVPQAILAALTCGIVMKTAYRVAAPTKPEAALFAGLLFLINVRFAMYVGFLSPTILLLFWFSLAALAASGPPTAANLSLLVVALVFAAGTQAGSFLIALAATMWLVIRFFRSKARGYLIAAALILLVSGAKPLLPGLLGQNQKDSINETGQRVLWEANNPFYEGMGPFSLWERRPGNRWSNWQATPTQLRQYNNYLERANQHSIKAALLWIREHPMQYAKLVFVRAWTTVGPFTGMMSPRNRLISLFLWLVIFPMGFYGWWVCRRMPVSEFAAIVTLSLVLSGAFVITDWYLKYRLPIDLLMIVYAAIGYSTLINFKSKSRFAST